MKTRFTTVDIIVILEELQPYVGMRVSQVYDVDNKTYLIKLQKPEAKAVLLLESGSRIHLTEFEWPKNPAPSGFSMKLRKHINNKRLESIGQLGVDRVINIQFGSGEAAYHLILEMYDRGNLVLTDHEYKILNILRPRVAGEEKFLVRETYPVELAKQEFTHLDENNLKNILKSGKEADTLRKLILPHFEYGPNLLEHLCSERNILLNTKLKDFNIEEGLSSLLAALEAASSFLQTANRLGLIVQKVETRPKHDGGEEQFCTFQEFHPFLFKQFEGKEELLTFPTFNAGCDNFFSQLEAQKIELKAVQQEKAALKKLENVKKDHETRIQSLQELQDLDRRRGELIEMNSSVVDNAIRVIMSAIANQIPWDQIKEIIKEATEKRDPVASRIRQLKLESNHIVMLLTDPYAHLDEDEDEDEVEESAQSKELMVDIDLALTAQANARKYFVQKKQAATKEKKTRESGSVALKSAEKKTKQTLKEMATISNINKARKVYWFEKFFWFISSENFLVIGGRDAQQNELLVKRYMKQTDVYVHADLHGASSVLIKNPTGNPVPPKTLNEAGQFSVCFSAAWDSKVITSAYWVHPDQVSKTAPSGEYLTVGSFMIRGKKNFLPPSHLMMGFGFLFKLEESSVERHKDERKIRGLDDTMSVTSEAVDSLVDTTEDPEIDVEAGDSSEEEEEEEPTRLQPIAEEKRRDADGEHTENKDEQLAAEDGDNESEHDCESSGDSDGGDDVAPTVAATEKEEEGNILQKEKEESLPEFPDTDVKIQYDRSGSVEVKAVGVVASHPEPSHQRPTAKPKQKAKGPPPPKNETVKEEPRRVENIRGKKGKLKKMKEKYKDQDEEERQLKMQILQSQGKEKDKGKKGKKGQGGKTGQPQEQRTKRPPPQKKKEDTAEVEGEVVVVEEERAAVNDETDMLDSLTGLPLPEDEILFAVPVCAPYTTLLNYKFKVKLTPGTGKRGKACKTALAIFIMDKATSQREKDLLKSVKDQDLARNLPGKVKLSAPHLQRVKGKK